MKKLLVAFIFLISLCVPVAADLNKWEGALAYVGDDKGHGSGFFTSPDHVITAKHVVTGGLKDHPFVIDSTGDKHMVTGIQISKATDVALLTVDNVNSSHPVANVSCRYPEPGEQLLSVGYPLGLPPVVSPLLTAAYDKHADEGDSLVVIGVVAPGMSGGPVFDGNGNVIGIVDAMIMLGDKKVSMPTGFEKIVPLKSVKELCIAVEGPKKA